MFIRRKFITALSYTWVSDIEITILNRFLWTAFSFIENKNICLYRLLFTVHSHNNVYDETKFIN